MFQLQHTVNTHGGRIVTSIEEASHIVDWDDEIDSGSFEDMLTEEYIRALDSRPNETETGIALVHWWYHPDSYDEWIQLDEENFEVPQDMEIAYSENKKWHVCCKFIKDVAQFNEWGNELDYEIETLENEEEILSQQNNGIGSSRKSRGKRKVDDIKKRREIPVAEAVSSSEKTITCAEPPADDPSRDSFIVANVSLGSAVTISFMKEDFKLDLIATKKRKAFEEFSPPNWFSSSSISDVEFKYLSPDILDENARYQYKYSTIRNFIVDLYMQKKSAYLSATECRRKLSADVCKIIRIHEFLDSFGIINFAVGVDARPTVPLLLPLNYSKPNCGQNDDGEVINTGENEKKWTESMDEKLLRAISIHRNNWNLIADEFNSRSIELTSLNGKMSANDCIVHFVSMPASKLVKFGEINGDLSSSVSQNNKICCRSFESVTSLRSKKLSEVLKSVTNLTAKEIIELYQFSQSKNDLSPTLVNVRTELLKFSIASTAKSAGEILCDSINNSLSDYVSLRLQALEDKVVNYWSILFKNIFVCTYVLNIIYICTEGRSVELSRVC